MPNLYVRAVSGRLVTRFGSSQYIGATRPFPHPTPAELEAGASPIQWNPEAVTLIPEADYHKHLREYDGAIRRGDLVRATAEEHAAYLASLEDDTHQETAQ